MVRVRVKIGVWIRLGLGLERGLGFVRGNLKVGNLNESLTIGTYR